MSSQRSSGNPASCRLISLNVHSGAPRVGSGSGPLRVFGNDAGAGVLWLCKGFESGTGLLAHEVARSLRPTAPCGCRSIALPDFPVA